jgi:hypothetical protein
MSGPNFLLDKSYIVDAAATNVEFGRFAKYSNVAGDRITTSAAPAAVAAADMIVGVYQDDIDAADVLTGKAVNTVRMLGISRVQAGGTFAAGDRVTSDANGKAVAASAAAGASKWVGGIALTPGANNGWANVYIPGPGTVITNGGT